MERTKPTIQQIAWRVGTSVAIAVTGFFSTGCGRRVDIGDQVTIKGKVVTTLLNDSQYGTLCEPEKTEVFDVEAEGARFEGGSAPPSRVLRVTSTEEDTDCSGKTGHIYATQARKIK